MTFVGKGFFYWHHLIKTSWPGPLRWGQALSPNFAVRLKNGESRAQTVHLASACLVGFCKGGLICGVLVAKRWESFVCGGGLLLHVALGQVHSSRGSAMPQAAKVIDRCNGSQFYLLQPWTWHVLITCHDQNEACLGWWAENRRGTIFGKGLCFFDLRLVQQKNAVANFTSQAGVCLGRWGGFCLLLIRKGIWTVR